MGIVKDYNRRVADAGSLDNLQEVTSTGTELFNYGISTISGTTEAKSYSLAAPVAGLRKTILVAAPSTGNITVTLDSTGTDFLGSTGNSIVFTGGSTAPVGAELIGLSTSRWAISSLEDGAIS